MKILSNLVIKRIGNRIKNIVHNPTDARFCLFNKKVKPNGIVIVIHESNRLGASLLALHTAEELVKQGENVYIISLQFGELNEEYAKVAPLQIIFSKNKFRNTLKKLKDNYGYNRILMITAAVGEFTKEAKELNFMVISEIHELASVIEQLGLQNATNQMLTYSDKIIFSTSQARDEIVRLFGNNCDTKKIYVIPQGTYYKKPTLTVIKSEKEKLYSQYPRLKSAKVIIGVGNTSARKGFDIFIETAIKMPHYMFVWAGKKERYYDQILKKFSHNMPDNFIYLGQLDNTELAGVYSIASLLLLSSRKDTLPSTIFEAMLFNVPVIGSQNSGGVADVINGKNGALTKEASSQAFRNAIIQLMKEDTYSKINDFMRHNKQDNSFTDYVQHIVKMY